MQKLEILPGDRFRLLAQIAVLRLSCSSGRSRHLRLLGGLLVAMLAGIGGTALPVAMAADSAGRGFDINNPEFQRQVSACFDCHSIYDDSADYVAPSLKGIVNRRVASNSDYGYSAALYQKAAAGRIWDEATLDEFLEAPLEFAPGNAMTYHGIPDADVRAQVIAWLASGPEILPAETLMVAQKNVQEVKQVLDIEADLEYGKFLAGVCLTCHTAADASGSVPPIKGLPAIYFINALLEYQQKQRLNPIMQTMSTPLGPEELAALTAFFSPSTP